MQTVDTNASFVYNENGLRVQKTVNGVVTNYTLHGKSVVHMTQGENELHFFYDAQNKPAVVVYNGTPYSYVKNLQGDVVALLNSTGAVVVSYVYDAWGRPISKTGTLASTLGTVQPFRYRGYVYDEETGLYYLRSRFYCASTCRFLSADHGIGIGAKLLSANLYAYAKGTPVCTIDTDGRDAYWLTDIDNVYGFGHTSLLIEDNRTGKWYYFFWGAANNAPFDEVKIQLIEIASVPFDKSGLLDLAALNIILSTTIVDDTVPLNEQEYIYDNFYETAALFTGYTTPSYLCAKKLLEDGNLQGREYNVLGTNCMQTSCYVMAMSCSPQGRENFGALASFIVPNDARYIVDDMTSRRAVDYSHYSPSFPESIFIGLIDYFDSIR